LALAYSLGPSHPQSVLVAAESFSSSVARTRANCYSNWDLDLWALCYTSLCDFDALTTTCYLSL